MRSGTEFSQFLRFYFYFFVTLMYFLLPNDLTIKSVIIKDLTVQIGICLARRSSNYNEIKCRPR